MRTLVTFQSASFNNTEPEEYFINPGCFGDDVALWLSATLRAHSIEADAAPEREDFGWYFEFTVAEGRHCCVIGSRPEPNPADAIWIAWIERSRGFLGSLVGRRNHGIAASAVEAVHEALRSAPQILNVAWHHREDFDSGREELAASSPGAA